MRRATCVSESPCDTRSTNCSSGVTVALLLPFGAQGAFALRPVHVLLSLRPVALRRRPVDVVAKL
jgi:hypothetical protein